MHFFVYDILSTLNKEKMKNEIILCFKSAEVRNSEVDASQKL